MLASGTHVRDVASTLGVPKSTLHRALHRFLDEPRDA
jgi:transposase-like protein